MAQAIITEQDLSWQVVFGFISIGASAIAVGLMLWAWFQAHPPAPQG